MSETKKPPMSPVFFTKHSYRVDILTGKEQGRQIYCTSFDQALKTVRDLTFHTGSRSQVVDVVTEKVLFPTSNGSLRA